MRMRRKSNLDERMKNCDGHLLFVEGEDFYKKNENEKNRLIDYKLCFKNDNAVWLDLGCGKGGFTMLAAEKHTDKNIIGVEKISNVLIDGLEKIKDTDLLNCAFLNCSVENLKYYIKPNSIERIFLNFSCPYPKKTYKNRRLTYYRYLELYKRLLRCGGEIHLKTDNEKFFEFSVQSLSENGFKLKNISLNLDKSDFSDNIETEYEKAFKLSGKRILRLEAYL